MTASAVGTSDAPVAFVTGASRGVGRGVALGFARARYRLVLAGRDEAALAEVQDLCAAAGSSEVLLSAFDVRSEQACTAAVDEAAERLGRLDVLINNAGVASSSKFLDTSLDEWRQTMAVDVEGPFLLTRAALPHLLEREHGAVIAIASVAARMGLPYVAAYTAAKHALLGLTRSLAAEYASSGVTFNCVCPYYVDTPMTEATISNIVAKTGRSREQAIAPLLSPQGRLIDPDEVAALCLLLAGPAGRSVTGQAINVDGGRHQG